MDAGTYTNTMAYAANGIGGGKTNTAIIIASQGYGMALLMLQEFVPNIQ